MSRNNRRRRIFFETQADTVRNPVDVILLQVMPNTYFCAYSVQIGDRHSRLQYLPCRFANLVVGIEQQLFLLTRITHDKCASQICAVAFELRGQVYDDEVPRLNRCPVNFPVNPGAAKPEFIVANSFLTALCDRFLAVIN